MLNLLLWLLLAVLAWPVAVAVLVVYPLVLALSVPFRIIGVSARGMLDLLEAIVRLPARMLNESPTT